MAVDLLSARRESSRKSHIESLLLLLAGVDERERIAAWCRACCRIVAAIRLLELGVKVCNLSRLDRDEPAEEGAALPVTSATIASILKRLECVRPRGRPIRIEHLRLHLLQLVRKVTTELHTRLRYGL